MFDACFVRPCAAALCAAALTATASGQAVPLPVVGFNHDVIANAGQTADASTTAVIDSDAVLFQEGFGDPGFGLPVNDLTDYTFTSQSSTTQYALQGASQANVLLLTAPSNVELPTEVSSGTLTLASPTVVSSLSVLASAFNAGGDMSYTLTFADASTQTGTFAVPDNFGGNPVGIFARGRFITGGNVLQQFEDNPRLYDLALDPITSTSPLVSVAFDNITGLGGDDRRVGIFALSGTVVPEPASLSLLALGALAVCGRRRRA